MINGIITTQLNRIPTTGGDVLHAMKNKDIGYSGFGEAYFSKIHGNSIKAWKMHKEMILNIIVPIGAIRFVLLDDRVSSETYGKYQKVTLSEENYCRLTIPNMVWFGFQGVSNKESLLLNIASIVHKQKEVERKKLNEIKFDWSNF